MDRPDYPVLETNLNAMVNIESIRRTKRSAASSDGGGEPCFSTTRSICISGRRLPVTAIGLRRVSHNVGARPPRVCARVPVNWCESGRRSPRPIHRGTRRVLCH